MIDRTPIEYKSYKLPLCTARRVIIGEAPLALDVRPGQRKWRPRVEVAGPPFDSLPTAVGWVGSVEAVIQQLRGLWGPLQCWTLGVWFILNLTSLLFVGVLLLSMESGLSALGGWGVRDL